jgi:mRNA interferase RelE/StbE
MIVKYKSSFEKDLLKIGEASVFEKTKAVILSVKSAERLQDKLAYRIKIGDYRIGFYFVNHEIELMRILHRKDIYKFFP